MFLHVGNGKTVKVGEIIGIFDLDTVSVSALSREFLSRGQSAGSVRYDDENIPRSVLLVGDKQNSNIVLSRISPSGLQARLNSPFEGTEE